LGHPCRAHEDANSARGAGEDIHVVERFRLADPNTLVATQQFTDPGSFVGTAARVLSFTRGTDHVYPYDSDPTYGLAIESRQGPAAR
jgi:hypothetical protein